MLLPVRLEALLVPVPVVPLVASVPVAETFCDLSALEESDRLLPAPLPLLAIMLLLYREKQPKPGDALA